MRTSKLEEEVTYKPPRAVFVTIAEFDTGFDGYGNRTSHYYATAVRNNERVVARTTAKRKQRGYAKYHEHAMYTIVQKIEKAWKIRNPKILPHPFKQERQSFGGKEVITDWVILEDSLVTGWGDSTLSEELALLEQLHRATLVKEALVEDALCYALEGKLAGTEAIERFLK